MLKFTSLNGQQLLVAVNVAIASLVLGKSLLDPSVGQPRPFELPEKVELSHWSLVDSKALEPFTMSTGESDHSIVGQSYTFVPDSSLRLDDGTTLAALLPENSGVEDITLTVEMRYMLDTSGFIERLLQHHTAFQNALVTVEDANIISAIEYEGGLGHYGVFQVKDITYLSACINPRGESTFSIDQFLHNQSIYDGDPGRFFNVFLGRDVWQDQRCLWTHIELAPSVLADGDNGDNPINLTPVVETAWQEWYQMWQPQFPAR